MTTAAAAADQADHAAIIARLAAAGLALPAPAAPVASYQPALIVGDMLYLSGQLPFRADGSVITGTLGEDIDEGVGADAARACGLMVLSQAARALGGDLGRVRQVVKLGVFVASAPRFTRQPQVANGASDLMALALGEAGRHTRSAVGVPVLPLGACVEVDAVIALRP